MTEVVELEILDIGVRTSLAEGANHVILREREHRRGRIELPR
jgi:hypothetical protein